MGGRSAISVCRALVASTPQSVARALRSVGESGRTHQAAPEIGRACPPLPVEFTLEALATEKLESVYSSETAAFCFHNSCAIAGFVFIPLR